MNTSIKIQTLVLLSLFVLIVNGLDYGQIEPSRVIQNPEGKHFILTEAFHDGNKIVTYSGIRNLEELAVWDIQKGKVIKSFPLIEYKNGNYFPFPRSLTISQNEKLLLAGGDAYSVRLWDIESGEIIHSFYTESKNQDLPSMLKTGSVKYVDFSQDSSMFLTLDEMDMLQIWDTSTLEELHRWDYFSYRKPQFVSNGKQVLAIDNKPEISKTVILDIETRETVREIVGYFFHLDKKNDLLITSHSAGESPKQLKNGSHYYLKIRVQNVFSNEIMDEYIFEEYAGSHVAISPSMNHLLIGEVNKKFTGLKHTLIVEHFLWITLIDRLNQQKSFIPNMFGKLKYNELSLNASLHPSSNTIDFLDDDSFYIAKQDKIYIYDIPAVASQAETSVPAK